MWRWTLKSLISEPAALVVSVAAAGCAFLLVMFFEAVYEGESDQVVAYVANADADVWVMQRGVANMHMATSYLTDWKLEQIERLPGVDAVEGILYLNTVITGADQQWFAYIVGLERASRQGGPWAMATGRAQPESGEAVVPAVFGQMSDLNLGDTIRITDRDFTVVGFSEGTFSIANSIVFVTKRDLEDIMKALDIVSYGLVKLEPGANPVRAAAQIEQAVDKVQALPADQFVRNDRKMAMQMGVETLALMTLIGGALAALLIAFAIYSQVARQRRELAVAKALGATHRALYVSVALQAVLITVASVTVATGLALIVMPVATAVIPSVTLKLTAAAVLRVAIVGLVVALLAALVPARQVARVDPLSAFQA
ncbi:MAG: FtsX-like permease family protein [Silicimonas sp.]|nr:FtsX-like permease family protein [Silicimonas sp.]